MATLDRPTVEYRTPDDLVRDIQRGALRVPPFQRGFRWESSDVIKLFDSLYRGFPIGNLLLWRRAAPAQRLTLGPVEVDAPETESALWVVDGQQRITSIAGALIAAEKTADPRFRIYLDLNDGKFKSIGARQEPPMSWIPVSLLLDTATLIRWMRSNADALSESQIALADQAAKAIREYQIPTYVVNSDDEEALVEIFNRMNDTGKRLSKAESFRALHSGLAGDQPTDLRSIGRISAELGFGALDDRLVLRCLLAFRGGDIFRDDFHDEFSSQADRVATFRDVGSLLREVVSLLQNEVGIPHVKVLPYSHVLPIVIRFMRVQGNPDERVAALLRRWIWRSSAIATRAHGISVVDVRRQVRAAQAVTALDAARELLGLVPISSDFVVDLGKVNLNHAMTKINILGLLSADPCDLKTGQPLDIRTLLADSASPLRAIINDRSVPGSGTIANRIVSLPVPTKLPQHALAAAPPEIALGHLVDEEAQDLLIRGRYDEFLLRRSAVATTLIKSHVDRMAEWGARDGRAISDIIRSVA